MNARGNGWQRRYINENSNIRNPMGNNAFKQKHRELGLCTQCSSPVHPGFTKCLKHLRSHAAAQMKHRLKYPERYRKMQRDIKKLRRQNGLCTGCGAPVEKGYVTCYNCREQLYNERFENATRIV